MYQSWHIVLLLGLLAGFLTLIPVMQGYDHASANGIIFNGFDFVEDSHAYAAYIHSGVEENPLFLKDYSTSEPQEGRYVVLLFTVLAIAQRILPIGIEVWWNIARVLVILFLSVSTYLLSAALYPGAKERITSTILLLFGGGFSWVVGLFGGLVPLLARLHSTELQYYLGYTVFSFMFHPLAMLSLGCILLAVRELLVFSTHPTAKHAALAGVFILLAFFDHPSAGVLGFLGGGLFLLYLLVKHSAHRSVRGVIPFLPFALAGGVALLYVLWARGDPIYAFHQTYYLAWDRHEPFWMFPFAIGIPLLLAAYALIKRPGFLDGARWALLGIFAAGAFLMTLFFPAGVKYLYLLFPFLALLAGPVLVLLSHSVAQRVPRISPRAAWAGLLVLCCLSAPFVTQARVDEVTQEAKHYLSPFENAGLDFLSTQGSGVVLSDMKIGSMISWTSPQRPLVAHGFLTIHIKDKLLDVESFFDPDASTSGKEGILTKYQITHVFYGPNEAKLGTVSPHLPLTPIFQKGDVTVYRVDLDSVK
jgi:hypothetical protein